MGDAGDVSSSIFNILECSCKFRCDLFCYFMCKNKLASASKIGAVDEECFSIRSSGCSGPIKSV